MICWSINRKKDPEGKKLPRTWLFEKDLFQNRFVPLTILSGTARGRTGMAPEKGIRPKDLIMSAVNARRIEFPITGRNRLLSSEKTGSKQ